MSKALSKMVWGIVFLLLSTTSYALYSPTQGELPEFREVLPKSIVKYLSHCDAQLAKKAIASVGEDKIQLIANYIGDEGWKYVMEHIKPELKPILEKYKPASGIDFKKLEAELKKVYPKIPAIWMNLLPEQEFIRYLKETEKLVRGVEALFMGWQGLRVFFETLDEKRHEALLDHTPDWVFIDIGLMRYDAIKDYKCIVYKQERVKGHLQDVEKILLKYRDKPFAIYMKWLDGPFKGREVLYNEAYYKDKVRVREGGSGISDRILGIAPAWIGLTSSLARRGTNHLVTEIGLKHLLEMIKKDYLRGKGTNDIKRVNHGIQEVDNHKVYVMENILPKDPKKGYYCYRIIHYIDYMRSLEIKAVMYNWDNQLQESYTYTQIAINPGLKDIDFDPENPEYRL